MSRVFVTGGSGFLGKHLVEALLRRGWEVIAPPHSALDLRNPAATAEAVRAAAPDALVHLAANVGGIGYDSSFPATILTENSMIGASVLEAARLSNVPKVLFPIAACGYPGDATGDLREDTFLEGRPHSTVEMYAHTRRQLLLSHYYYRHQYNMNTVALILTNMYGPGDRYHEAESHVAAALIRRFTEAAEQGAASVECWGTGAPVREFIYAPDAAQAIGFALENYDGEAPINIGTGRGTSIRELAELASSSAGYGGEVVWNTEKPDGAMRKVLDVTRMRDILHWEPPTTLEDGVAETVKWYRANRSEANRYSKASAE